MNVVEGVGDGGLGGADDKVDEDLEEAVLVFVCYCDCD